MGVNMADFTRMALCIDKLALELRVEVRSISSKTWASLDKKTR